VVQNQFFKEEEKEVEKIIEEAGEVLETKEIEEMVKKSVEDVTRAKLFYRLNNLRGEGLIKGKFVGPGKGVWIWWRTDAFK
jgi:repressor of nif and glnA expression